LAGAYPSAGSCESLRRQCGLRRKPRARALSSIQFRKPDVYHVGIAVVPKPQPHLYNAWFQEIYMETLETNPDGYRVSAPINTYPNRNHGLSGGGRRCMFAC
jgi:hypothetical protein